LGAEFSFLASLITVHLNKKGKWIAASNLVKEMEKMKRKVNFTAALEDIK
jgi:hypothetical protein